MAIRTLIARTPNREAGSALHDAPPFLLWTEIAEVAVFNPSAPPVMHGQEPGADTALYLTRHEIQVDVKEGKTRDKAMQATDAFLFFASDLNSDLPVMSCHGYSRFRNILPDGTTLILLIS